MTFILIVSSVKMVLDVEAGHRMDRKGVVKWMIATIIGGFFFLGSQAWEWYHFTHGSEFGKVELSDGSQAIVQGHFGEIEKFTVTKGGTEHKVGEEITDDLMHHFQHAAMNGHLHMHGKVMQIHLEDGSLANVTKKADDHLSLIVKKDANAGNVGKRIEGVEAEKLYYEALTSGVKNRVIYGAKFFGDDQFGLNEYGPQQYAQFFYFITGFHGFHVFSGVMINIIILIGVLRGTYHKRGHYEMVEKTGLYWHFVDLVWVFVFTFFYLV